MSYMREGYPLNYFKTGKSEYVYPSSSTGTVNDYGSLESMSKQTFIELVTIMVQYETHDPAFAKRVLHRLAKDYGIEDDLRGAAEP